MPELHEAMKEIGQRIENSDSFDDIWELFCLRVLIMVLWKKQIIYMLFLLNLSGMILALGMLYMRYFLKKKMTM